MAHDMFAVGSSYDYVISDLYDSAKILIKYK